MTYSKNEWDQLKTVMVGSAAGARIPEIDISMRTINYADVEDVSSIPIGTYPSLVKKEANQDLDILVKWLEREGITVTRPGAKNPTKYYDYCPRDLIFLHGDHAIATPMPIKARHQNYKNISHCFRNLSVPTRNTSDSLYNLDCVGNPDILALNEVAPSFDAANVLRANDDLLYLVSNSGNKAGAEYLRQTTGLNVHLLEGVYSYMHIDSTVAFLREGLMLLNPERIKSVDVLPKPFCDWDYIMCPPPTDIGYYGNYCNASKWINMNLLSINTRLVVIEEHQTALQHELAKHNIESMMLPMRQQRTLGGGFHCVTLDIHRC